MASSTYYEIITRESKPSVAGVEPVQRNKGGRPIPGYSYTIEGLRISDERIKELLCEEISGDGYPYGYKKLTDVLVKDHGITINHKKVYRLCCELNILKPQRIKKIRHPRRLANRFLVTGPNKLWEMDIKYGYIHGENRFFVQLSVIDVFDRCVIAYHLGLTCTAIDARRTLQEALMKRGLQQQPSGLVIRTDNGPQFIAHAFEQFCEETGIIHERIPVKTPNMNAHIESFHSILNDDCYNRHEFVSYAHAYEIVAWYMEYYNRRRRHGSIKNMPPERYHKAIMSNLIKAESLTA